MATSIHFPGNADPKIRPGYPYSMTLIPALGKEMMAYLRQGLDRSLPGVTFEVEYPEPNIEADRQVATIVRVSPGESKRLPFPGEVMGRMAAFIGPVSLYDHANRPG